MLSEFFTRLHLETQAYVSIIMDGANPSRGQFPHPLRTGASQSTPHTQDRVPMLWPAPTEETQNKHGTVGPPSFEALYRVPRPDNDFPASCFWSMARACGPYSCCQFVFFTSSCATTYTAMTLSFSHVKQHAKSSSAPPYTTPSVPGLSANMIATPLCPHTVQ